MLEVNLEESRVCRDAKAEGKRESKLELLPKLINRGSSVEEVSDFLELSLGDFSKALQK